MFFVSLICLLFECFSREALGLTAMPREVEPALHEVDTVRPEELEVDVQGDDAAVLGGHCLSKATCLMRPHLLFMRVSSCQGSP